MSSESDERTKPESGVDSPSADDCIDENVGGTVPLKKGPWTSAEDAILVEYVTKHGEGNWNAVQKHSGLARCGKSCRLRWANHLRPNLKKGAFTPEEENRIIELHAQIGNKWARMAAELPGRTDNEIKNYWNTRIKRRQRAGLPIYPPGVSLLPSDENLESDNLNNLSGNDGHPDLMPMDHLEIPAVEFKNLDLNNHFKAPGMLSYPGLNLHDIHPSSLLAQGVKPTILDNRLDPTVHPSKRLRGSELLFPDYSSPIFNAFPGGNQYQSESCMQIGESSALSAYDHNPATDLASSSSLSNDHPSSEPPGAMKQELPSLQRQMGTWGSPSPSSPLPFYNSADVLIEAPPNEQMQSCNLLSQNSGLLEAVFFEPETMITPNGNGVHHYPNIPSMAANTMDCSAPVLHDSEWRPCEDQLSYSPSSVFSESTRVSGNSMDDPFAGPLPVMEDTIHGGVVTYDDIIDPSNELIYSGQDFLLESGPFGSVYHPTEEHSLLYDPTGTLLVDDLSMDRDKVDLGATSSAQAPHANGSGAWNDKHITRQCKFTSA